MSSEHDFQLVQDLEKAVVQCEAARTQASKEPDPIQKK